MMDVKGFVKDNLLKLIFVAAVIVLAVIATARAAMTKSPKTIRAATKRLNT